MNHIMHFVISTPKHGLEITLDMSIEGYEIISKLDTDYAKDLAMHQSVTRYSILLNGAYVDWISKIEIKNATIEIKNATMCYLRSM